MNIISKPGPLVRAIEQQSAIWLEMTYPDIYDALNKELETGHKVEDIKRILRRLFGNDLREPFVARVIQAAEFMSNEQLTVIQ